MSHPRFHPPMLATLVDGAVEGDEWIFERKLDGIRLIALRDGDRVRLMTRNRKDHAARYPELVEALRAQPHRRFVVDGEVVAFDGAITSFSRLQGRSGLTDPRQVQASGIAVYLYLFDLLHLDGEDLVRRPLRQRKSLLREAFHFDDPLRFCAHRNAHGPSYLAEACAAGWEGLIAKRADSPYRSSRHRDWLKLKCVTRQEFVIGGYTDPRGSRARFGALLLGHHHDGDLVYAGRVGTGFDEQTLDRLGDALEARRRDTPPFADPPLVEAHWVHPELVCEVGFTEWTTAGLLRHPRYLGLREDKDPSEVRREVPAPAPSR
jgi:bifunctional non-homologous end joining protein LigD